MKKLLSLLALTVFGAWNVNVVAQDELRELPRNTVSLNFGPGLVTSDIITYRGATLTKYSTSLSLDYVLSYEHLYSDGFGFGVEVSQMHIDRDGCLNLFYVGPKAVYAKMLSPKWRFHISLGVGYAADDGEMGFSADGSTDWGNLLHGIGFVDNAGFDYRFNRHFGIGAQVRSMMTLFPKYSGYSKEKGRFVREGIDNISLQLGARYYF